MINEHWSSEIIRLHDLVNSLRNSKTPAAASKTSALQIIGIIVNHISYMVGIMLN